MPRRLALLTLPFLALLSSCGHPPPPAEHAHRLALAGAAACERYAPPEKKPACLAAVRALTAAVREGLDHAHESRDDAGPPG